MSVFESVPVNRSDEVFEDMPGPENVRNFEDFVSISELDSGTGAPLLGGVKEMYGFAQGRGMASPQERELKKAALVLEGPNDNQQQQQREAEQQKKPAEADEFSYRRVTRSAFKQKLVLGKKQKLLKLVLEDNDNQPQKQREEEKQQKSVKDDGFLYRRMTRSAFKQKLGSSNDGDSQQQQQLKAKKQKKSVKDTDDAEGPFLCASTNSCVDGGKFQNLSLITHKNWGLADDADNQKQHPRKGKRQEKLVKNDDDANSGRTKQKLGLLNNCVGNQQQQQRQQRMGEHKQWRIFTKKEKQIYDKKVKESRGFDVGDVPSEVLEMGLIRPLQYFEQNPVMFGRLKIFSKLAIDKYNKENKKEYQFVKVLKANRRLVAGFKYFITFQAKDMVGAVPENFQAIVYAGICDTEVQFCNPER